MEKYNLRISFGNVIGNMISSAEDNVMLINETSKYESEFCDWYQKILEKQYEMYKSFENDNVFIFDKRSW
jgi:hypothetical protein